MSRKNIYNILENTGFSFQREYSQLLFLFSKENKNYYGYGMSTTLQQYINGTYFRDLEFRGSYLDIESMMIGLGFSNLCHALNKLFLLCEFLLAVMPEEKLKNNETAYNQANTIVSNICYILDKTNHMLHNLNGTDYEHPKYVIVEKDKAAIEAAALVQDEHVSIELLEYNRFTLKDDLAEKRRILSSIALYIEPLLKSRKLQKGGYGQLESDAGFLANNFHIRHNNKTGAKAQEYIVSLSDSDLENWYDKAYSVFLSVIILSDQIDTAGELKTLKSSYYWKS